MPKNRLNFAIAALTLPLILAACSTREPKSYSKDDAQQRIVADRAKMYADQEPVTGPITFYEAAARALKYNLDYRLKLMESALASNLRDVSSYEMLPTLAASAGFAGRSNDSGGTSVGIVDHEVTLRPSTSEERYRSVDSLGLTWSLLDFGVAYYRNQQKNDQVLMAEEHRRKVAQNVLQDVRSAYWRALGAQRLMPEVDSLLARTNEALKAAREAEEKGLLPRQEILAYQRALIDSVYLLTVRREDLEFAQAELAALMSLPPGTPMRLADAPELPLPKLSQTGEHLEQLALEKSPEIMEEWYRKRVDDTDLKIAKAQLWPNLTLSLTGEFDSNKYLYNNLWAASGAQVSLNLLKLLQLPSLNAAQAAQQDTDDARRIALSMAILTQVRVGMLRYQLASQEVEFSDQSLRVDKSLLDYAEAANASTLGSKLEQIRAEGRYLLSRYEHQAAYSNAQAAWGRLYNSVGLDVFPEAIQGRDIKTLAGEIERTLNGWERNRLLEAPPEEARADAKP